MGKTLCNSCEKELSLNKSVVEYHRDNVPKEIQKLLFFPHEDIKVFCSTSCLLKYQRNVLKKNLLKSWILKKHMYGLKLSVLIEGEANPIFSAIHDLRMYQFKHSENLELKTKIETQCEELTKIYKEVIQYDEKL